MTPESQKRKWKQNIHGWLWAVMLRGNFDYKHVLYGAGEAHKLMVVIREDD